MFKALLGVGGAILILLSLVVIYKSQLSPATTFKEPITTKAPPSVNINLDSGFNNFKSHTGLSLETLPCELYEQKNKHVSSSGRFSSGDYDGATAQLLLSLIKQINKVKNQKSLLENLKVVKPSKLAIDTAKLQRLYNNLIKTKHTIDDRQEQIKLLKEKFKPNVVSGKQWQIDVEKQFVSYLNKRLHYLKSLKAKSPDDNAKNDINRMEKTLAKSEETLFQIVDDIDQNKNVVKHDDEISQLENLKIYWQLRLEEVRKCQKTDKGYRSDQSNDIYRELDRLRVAQSHHDNSDYCMELRKHLVLKLIRQFDVIQSDFNCIKQKSRVQDELKKVNNRLEILKDKNKKLSDINPNKHNDDLATLKQNYNEINRAFQSGVKKLEMGYDANVLKEIIQNTENDLRNRQARLDELLKDNSNHNYNEDPNKIVNLVNMNSKLKQQYCKDYEEYERQNQRIRNKIDQVSADRSVQNVGLERYLTISEEMKKSLNQIYQIKEKLVVKLGQL